jgi:hypothetical protein
MKLTAKLLILGFILALALVLHLVYWHHTIDDAYISFRYAQNFVKGHGLSWNQGEKPVEGYSNFMWVLLTIPWEALEWDSVFIMKIIGLLFGLASVVVLFLISSRLCSSVWFGFLPPLILAVSPAFATWAVSGLETSFYVFTGLVCVLLLLREEGDPDHAPVSRTACTCLGLLPMIRPEGFVFMGGALFYKILGFKREEPVLPQARRLLVWSLPFIILFTGYSIFRWIYYGNFIPNSVMAKKGFFGGVDYIWFFVRYYSPVYMLFFCLSFFKDKIRREMIFFGILVLAYFGGIMNTVPIQGDFCRFLLPVFPLVLAGTAVTLEMCLEKTRTMKKSLYRAGWAVLVVAAVAFPIKFIPWIYKITTEYDAGHQKAHVQLGLWLKQSYAPDTRLAAFDCGAIPYYSGFATYDLYGLSNEYVRANGLSVEHLLEWNPHLICLDFAEEQGFFTPRKPEDSLIYEHPDFKKNFIPVKKIDRKLYWIWVFQREIMEMQKGNVRLARLQSGS